MVGIVVNEERGEARTHRCEGAGMRQEQDASVDVVIAAKGLSLRKAARALWLARRGSSRQHEESSVAYQGTNRVMVLVLLLSAAVELLLVDVLLSVLWMRLLALTLGLLAVLGLLAFLAARREYPHRTANGALTIHCGACFELSIPLEFVDMVAERKRMIHQKHIAEVRDGVLSVPVNGRTNLVITLHSPVKVHLKKTGTALVREIQVFALDPDSGTQKLRSGGPAEDDDDDDVDGELTGGLARRLLRSRALRWVGPLVLLAETAIVTAEVTLVEHGESERRWPWGWAVRGSRSRTGRLGGLAAV